MVLALDILLLMVMKNCTLTRRSPPQSLMSTGWYGVALKGIMRPANYHEQTTSAGCFYYNHLNISIAIF